MSGREPLDVEGVLWVAAIDRVPIRERIAWVKTMLAQVEQINSMRALPAVSPVPPEPPDPTLPPEAEGQPWHYGWWAVGAPPEPKT